MIAAVRPPAKTHVATNAPKPIAICAMYGTPPAGTVRIWCGIA